MVDNLVVCGVVKYRDYVIIYDPPPIPIRRFDWSWAHEDFDGSTDGNDRRCGSSVSVEAAKRDIDELISSMVPKPRPNGVCGRCGIHDGTSYGFDPFMYEIYQDETKCWLCETCLTELSNEI